jgi:hypothetical protein
MKGVYDYIGVKINSKTKKFKIFSSFLRIWLKSFKKVLTWPKIFFFKKFEFWYQNNSEFRADFKTVEKTAKNLLTKKGAKLEYALFNTTNLQQFFANNSFCVHFFAIMFTDLKSA